LPTFLTCLWAAPGAVSARGPLGVGIEESLEAPLSEAALGAVLVRHAFAEVDHAATPAGLRARFGVQRWSRVVCREVSNSHAF